MDLIYIFKRNVKMTKRRLNNLQDIPLNFNNHNYDKYYSLMSIKSISYALSERQSIKWMIDSLFDRNHSRWIYNPEDNADIENKIIEDKEYYLYFILGEITDPIRILHYEEQKDTKDKLSSIKKDTFYDYPFIQPIRELSEESERGFSLRFNGEDWKNYPTIQINLDFSDDMILNDIKKYLKKIRQENVHKHKLMPPEAFLINFNRYRSFQVIDLLFWQQLTNQHINYEVMANFLFPDGEFDYRQLRESIIPFVKKLLDRNSQDTAYVHYLADKSCEN